MLDANGGSLLLQDRKVSDNILTLIEKRRTGRVLRHGVRCVRRRALPEHGGMQSKDRNFKTASRGRQEPLRGV